MRNNIFVDCCKKWNQLTAAVKASMAFVVCSVLQKSISLLTTPLFVRILSTEEYGQFTLYQSWLNILTVFATLNLAAGVFNNGMIRYESDRDRYISSMQGLSTAATVILFLVYCLGAPFWDGQLNLPRPVIVAMFLEMLFMPAFQYWSMRQRFEYRYKALIAVTLAVSVLNPCIGLLAVKLAVHKGVARILSTCALNAAVGAFFYLYNLRRGRDLYEKKYWVFALKFNLPLIPHYLSAMILAQADRIMIEQRFGKTPVAIYGVGYSIGMIMTIVVSSINATFIPWTYQMCKQRCFHKIGRTANLLLLLVAGITLVPILTAPEIVRIVGTQEYMPAIWVIPPVSVANYLIFVYSLFSNIEFYYAENYFVMAASSAAAISNIFLNAIFMERFGYLAGGYTTVACYAILAVAHYCFMRRVQKKHKQTDTIYAVPEIMAITAVLVLLSAGSMALYGAPYIRYGILLAGCILLLIKRRAILNIIFAMKGNENQL